MTLHLGTVLGDPVVDVGVSDDKRKVVEREDEDEDDGEDEEMEVEDGVSNAVRDIFISGDCKTLAVLVSKRTSLCLYKLSEDNRIDLISTIDTPSIVEGAGFLSNTDIVILQSHEPHFTCYTFNSSEYSHQINSKVTKDLQDLTLSALSLGLFKDRVIAHVTEEEETRPSKKVKV